MATKTAPLGSGSGGTKANVMLLLDVSRSMNRITGQEVEEIRDIEFDSDGYSYIAQDDGTIYIYDPSGDFVGQVGGTNQWDFANSAKIGEVIDMTFDAEGNLYIADTKSNKKRVQKIPASRLYEDTTTGSMSYINNINGLKSIDIDKPNDLLYVMKADGNGSFDTNVAVYDTDLNHLRDWSTSFHSSTNYLAVDDDGYIYVPDKSGGDRYIRKFDTNGNELLSFTFQDPSSGKFLATGIEIADNGNIYIAGENKDSIYIYDSAGNFLTKNSSLALDAPKTLSKDQNGDIWVSDEHPGNPADFAINIDNPTEFLPPVAQMRIEKAAQAIQAVVADSALNTKVNFGLITWAADGDEELRVEISPTGATEISAFMDLVLANPTSYLEFGTYPTSAMELARNYYDNNISGKPTPIDSTISCQQTINIVITDGMWTNASGGCSSTSCREATQVSVDAIAEDLYDNDNIPTYVLAAFLDETQLAEAMPYYTTLSVAGGTDPLSPLIADNNSEIISAINTYIADAINQSIAFSSPTIVPSGAGTDYILHSVFDYIPNHQWRGQLRKYALTNTGSIGAQQWEAGAQLNDITSSERKIWTVHSGVSYAVDYNNFIADNVSYFHSRLATVDTTASENLIKFIRGEDVYNEYPLGIDSAGTTLATGDRWKLADIYNSRPVVVGPPNAVIDSNMPTHTEQYYRSANGYQSFKEGSSCGVACTQRDTVVYVGSNGGMLHAFDYETGEEKWAFIPPSVIPNFNQAISSIAGESESIYGVDGLLTVKDIYYSGQWRTVLIGGLRQGGKSYFALDVTNPDAPQHLFTFANESLTHGQISYWDASGVHYTYSTLSGAPTPVPTNLDYSGLGEAWSEPVISLIPDQLGGTRWVALIGGGMNSGSGSYGSNLYVVDLESSIESGKIIETISFGETKSSNSINNAVPQTVSVINGDSTSNFTHTGVIAYFTDLDGILHKINFTDSGTLYNDGELYDTNTTKTNGRVPYFQTAATLSSSGVLRLFYGTGDMLELNNSDSAISNRVHAIKDANFPLITTSSTLTDSDLNDVTSATETGTSCTGDSTAQGWYFDIGTDKVTASLTVNNSYVFVPRYTPTTGSSACEVGNASISEHHFTCGTVERQTNLGPGVLSEVVIYKGKLYAGISSADPLATTPAGFEKIDNLIVGDPSAAVNVLVTVESWQELYP